MHVATYALARLMLFGFGWGVATLLALSADIMMIGAKWPVFGLIAAWWTYACALYVQGEAGDQPAGDQPAEDLASTAPQEGAILRIGLAVTTPAAASPAPSGRHSRRPAADLP
jgi:hypothetical protein